jgi:hypothetical protein
MKYVGLILLLLLSLSAFSHPRDSARAAERLQARIERKHIRTVEKEAAKAEKEKAKYERKRASIMQLWDQRSMQQKRTDRRALIFLALCAGAVVHIMSSHQE